MWHVVMQSCGTVMCVILFLKINSAECFSVSFFPKSTVNSDTVANSVNGLISLLLRCVTNGICGQNDLAPASAATTTSMSLITSTTQLPETTVFSAFTTSASTTSTVPAATTTPGRPTKSTRRPSTTDSSVTFSQASYTFSTSACTTGTTAGTVTASNASNYTISNTQFAISAAGQITITNAIAAGTYSATVTGFSTAGSASIPVIITIACGSNPSTGSCAANVSPTYSGPTACTASSSELGYPITTAQVSAADITAILDAHNTYRRGVDATDMRKLQWDPCLASSAQAWASKCDAANPHDTYSARKAPGFPQGCGQNKASGTSGFLTWKTAIDLWYNEVKDFTYCSSSNVFAKVGHYTQVMWAETSLIGCGFVVCGGVDVFICNYCTPGNFGTEPAIYCPWKSGTSATKCSACSTGSGCIAGDCLCA